MSSSLLSSQMMKRDIPMSFMNSMYSTCRVDAAW